MDTQRNKEFFYEIKKHLTPSRFYHSLNVAYEAYRLAGIYKADREKAFTAGLLHDIMKAVALYNTVAPDGFRRQRFRSVGDIGVYRFGPC